MKGLSIRVFWSRFTLRHARQEWLQTTLLLAILSLGVGTFLSIRLANRSAVDGFRLFTESLSGPSDWIIETSGTGIPVKDLPAIRTVLGNTPAELYPVVERSATALQGPGESPLRIRLLGLDLVQAQSAADETILDETSELWDLLDEPDHVLVTRGIASRLGLEKGDSTEWILDGVPRRFTVAGILPEYRDNTPLPDNLAVADIAALIEKLSLETVDRVEVVIPDGSQRKAFVTEAGSQLQQLSSKGWSIASPDDQQIDGESMTAAFRLNLTVLSLIALLVGMYLIAQTLDATVSRRRGEIATLRSLGLERREIYRLWLSEAVLYGIMAGVLGLFAGMLLAQFTVEAVTTTVQALYRDTAQNALTLHISDILLCLGMGIAGSLVAAWIPARDAASTPPAQFLRMGKRIPPFPLFQHTWIGYLALLAGAVLLLLPPVKTSTGGNVPVAGYAAALLWLSGGTLLAASLLKHAGTALIRVFPNRAETRLAGSRLQQPTSRHQLALSGFFVAIGMAASMAYLISSFDYTVTSWLQQRLRADLFVSSIGFQGSDNDQTMPAAILDAIEATEGIRSMDRFASVNVEINNTRAALGGVHFDLLGTDQTLLWMQEPLPGDSAPGQVDAIAYCNENLHRKAGLQVSDILQLDTPDGVKQLWIAGLHSDYARDNGLLLVDLQKLEEWYGIQSYSTASIFLQPGIEPAVIQQQLQSRYPGLAIRQNAELMQAALFIFNQTFAVTYALQAIGLIVALAGLFLSLLSLLRESSRELSLQGTLGMSRTEIAFSTSLEGTGVAAAGLLAGLILSAALGRVLIFVINRQSFGWTLQTAWPWSDITVLSITVIALGFGISYLAGLLHMRKWKREPL